MIAAVGREYPQQTELTGSPEMSHNIVFFSVHADDLPRAQRFYERVFGWKFEPWGPPGFFLVATGDKDDPGIQGSMQKRHEVVAGQAPLRLRMHNRGR